MSSHLDVVKEYTKCRSSEDLDGCLALVADDVKLVSAKDGTFEGKEAFSKYLRDNKSPPKSEWEEPKEEGDSVIIAGKVRILLMWWSVQSEFRFNSEGKITYIEIKRV